MRGCYRRVIVVLALLGALWPISGVAQPASGARVALVIGNDRYLHQPVLDNPVRDAQAVAATLSGLGFRVRAAENLGREAMIEALLAFADAARGAEVAVIYFAGHGMQLDSGGMAENHLIPVDARLADARRVPDETLPLSRVLREVDGVRALVVLLDACRNNPVAQRMAGLGTRMAARSGLAPVPEAMSQGALIAFAAAPGQVALDGERGANGPFARALARHLAEPVEVGLALQRTAAAVRDATGGRQRPEVLNRLTLTEHLFLAAQPRPASVPSPTPAPDALTMETALWNAVRESSRRDDLQAYLDRFPQGLYAPLARNRLAALADAAARTDTTPSPSPSPSPPRARSDEASLRPPAPAIVEPASPPRGGRFVVGPCGSIVDAQTRLEWFVGPDRNFSWTEASSWAASLQDCGGQWAMPTRAQLATLFEAGKSAGQGYFTQGRHFPAQIDPVFAGIGGGSWVWTSGSATGQGAPAFNFNQNIEVRMGRQRRGPSGPRFRGQTSAGQMIDCPLYRDAGWTRVQAKETPMQRIRSGTNFTSYALGGLTIVALRDGHVDMPPSRLRQPGDRPFGADMPAEVRLVDGRLRLSVNAFLIIGEGRHILIDTGAASAWEPSMGLLPEALAEAGVAREAIDTVAVTHTHLDHVAGLVAADGSDAFPKLRHLYIPQAELALFHRDERLARFHARCEGFGDGFALSDSITAVAAHGHEVGHSAFEVASGGEALLIWGDVVHVPSIQFARPELTWEYDDDQAAARATRLRMLERSARPGVFVAGAHLDFPGLGSVTRVGEGYGFAPA